MSERKGHSLLWIIVPITLAWIVSLFRTLSFTPVRGWAVGVSSGAVWIEHPLPGDDSAWQIDARTAFGWPRLLPAVESDPQGGWQDWIVPLWPISLGCWIALASRPLRMLSNVAVPQQGESHGPRH